MSVQLVDVRADAARNRSRILDAARVLVARSGPDVPMEAIAAEAGVAVGTLYRHHPTKAALLAAVLADSADQLGGATRDAVAAVRGGADAGRELAALVRRYAGHYATDRAVKAAVAALGPAVPADPGAYPEGGPERRAAEAIEELLGLARARGAVRDDVTLADLVLVLGALPGPEAGAAARERFVEIVLAGLGVAPSRDAGAVPGRRPPGPVGGPQ
jgi:AcrR family transcriptional regulator